MDEYRLPRSTNKEMKRIEGVRNFDQAIVDAMNAAHKAGVSFDDLKATLERWVSLMEIEE